MRRYLIFLVLWLLLSGLIGGCQGEPQAKEQAVTFAQLFSSPERYNGQYIILEGFYFSGFEVSVLSEILEYSGYAEGHLVPKGRMIWVEGGIAKEVYDQLYEQQMMGPSERYGKIRVRGKFEYGGEYGHLGGYKYQIIPSQTEHLPWVPQ